MSVYLREIKRNESIAPGELRDFLIRLEMVETSEEVWNSFVTLMHSLGLPICDYVCATDYRDWEQAQFIRTTYSSEWIDWARQNPNIRKTSYFRSHVVQCLTPIAVGTAYMDQMGDLPPERIEIMERTAQMGLRAGIAIPLRFESPGQAGIMTLGGDYDRAPFEALMARHGWTIHAATLSAHTRYTELFRSEFVQRNELTEKQREMVALVGSGLLDKQISHALGISISAVRQRLAAVQAKTGTRNRAELAALAMRVGLVPDPMLKPHTSELTVFLSTADGTSGCEGVRSPPDGPFDTGRDAAE